MGSSALVHLDRHCAAERVGCGNSQLPSGTAGQNSPLGSVYSCVRQLVRAHVPGTRRCMRALTWGCVRMCVPVFGSLYS